MEYKDYYKIMGVKRDASADEIRRAYRKLARKYHPDVSKEKDAEVRFKELGEAYEVLKDPEKRRAYDQLGAHWKAGQNFRPPPDWSPDFDFRTGTGYRPGGDGFSDFFESLFGAGFGSPRGPSRGFDRRGEDQHARVVIDLEDAYRGATRTITLSTPARDAQGRPVNRERTLKVRIPKGVKRGQHIRLAGQGGAGTGSGASGELYLEVDFRPHPYYQVDGADVFLDLPVAPWEAALGAVVQAPTPGGSVDLKIPAGSQQGRKLRLKGRGIPSTPPGDLYAVLRIVLPSADSDEAKAAYRKLSELDFDPRAALRGRDGR